MARPKTAHAGSVAAHVSKWHPKVLYLPALRKPFPCSLWLLGYCGQTVRAYRSCGDVERHLLDHSKPFRALNDAANLPCTWPSSSNYSRLYRRVHQVSIRIRDLLKCSRDSLPNSQAHWRNKVDRVKDSRSGGSLAWRPDNLQDCSSQGQQFLQSPLASTIIMESSSPSSPALKLSGRENRYVSLLGKGLSRKRLLQTRPERDLQRPVKRNPIR
jgi:hypothetical protein